MKQKYKFLFRAGDLYLMTLLSIRTGERDRAAWELAKRIAKAGGYEAVYLIWSGPEDEEIPEEIRDELIRERVAT